MSDDLEQHREFCRQVLRAFPGTKITLRESGTSLTSAANHNDHDQPTALHMERDRLRRAAKVRPSG